jgi:hypothetical protein
LAFAAAIAFSAGCTHAFAAASICISLAMMSVAYFSTPSLSVYLRVFRRPSM